MRTARPGLGALAAALVLLPAALGAAKPARIVAIGPAVSETVAALGAADSLVAVDSSSVYPPALRGLPQVGYMRALSAEGVLSLNPGVLLISADAGPPAALKQLRGTGLPVVVMPDGHSPATVMESVRRVGGGDRRCRRAQRRRACCSCWPTPPTA
jgi:iron complex transport system substrate-binding protein